MSARVREVAVVGRDAALWLTALALRRAFGRTDLAIPRGCHPLVGKVPVEERTERMESLLAVIERGVRSLPTVEAYLAPAGLRATISP